MRSLAVLALLVLAPGADVAKELEAKDPEVRLAAVRSLASGEAREHRDRERLLIGALGDSDWQVVEEAAAALGQGTEKSLEPLVALALDGPVRRLRRTAAEALGKREAGAASEAYEELARKVSRKLALPACEAMASLAPVLDGKVSLKPLEKASKSKEDAVRAAAARALVLLAGKERPAYLKELAGGEDVQLAAAAVEAAGQAGDPACLAVLLATLARPALIDVLERRVDEACRAILAAEPADLGARLEPVRAALADDAGAEARPRLARLVATLVEERGADARRAADAATALELLEALLGDSLPAARSAAVWALRRVGTDEAWERAARFGREDGDAHVRLIALDTLLRGAGGTDPRTQALALELLAADPDEGVRELAAVALGVKELEQAVAPLGQALGDPSWAVAVCAAVSLGKTKLPAAVAPLAALYRTADDWRLRGAAVVGLARTREREGVPAVIAALEDDEPLVRRCAEEYLVSLSNDRSMERDVGRWTAWWSANGGRVRMELPEEVLKRRRELGYVSPTQLDPSAFYEGLDVVVYEAPRAGGDRIEDVLSFLEIEHRLTGTGKVTRDELHPGAILASNCTGEMQAGDLERVAWFLRAGGSVFGSCWALQRTIARVYPGLVRRLATKGDVLDDVVASACRPESPYLEGVFGTDVRPIYALEGAFLIDVLDPERVEVLVDSPACAERWGGGNLAAWFHAGHGVVLDSVNHFDSQGFERARGLKKDVERMAWAVDHMGLGLEDVRALRAEKFWDRGQSAAERIKDLSVFRVITNFVRRKRAAQEL